MPLNMGKINSNKNRVLVKKPMCTLLAVLDIMAHNAARKRGASFSGASGFNVEDLVVNILLV